MKENIYIMPTPLGVGCSLLVFILLVAGESTGHSGLSYLAAMLVAVALVSMFLTHRNMKDLVVQGPEELFSMEGEQADCALSVYNIEREMKWGLEIGLRLKRDKSHRAWLQTPFFSPRALKLTIGQVDPLGSANVKMTFEALDRGIYECPGIVLSSIYPLAFFRSWRFFQLETRRYVYPRPVGFEVGDLGESEGERQGKQAHILDFDGHRSYREGDPPRHLDWKALARGRGLLIKEFKGGGQRYLHLSLRSTPGRSLMQKLRQLSYWVHEAWRAGDQYTLELAAGERFKGDGEGHFLRCLKALASYDDQ